MSSFIENRINDFILALKRGKIAGSYQAAKQTAELLRIIIASTKWTNAKHLIEIIKQYGKKMTQAKPLELAIGNTIRRVLCLIREEYTQYELEKEEQQQTQPPLIDEKSALRRSQSLILSQTPSLYKVLDEDTEQPVDLSKSYTDLKATILNSLNDLIDEMGSVYKNIAEQALDHIHANEVIMTFGKSQTVEEFLKFAARKRKFEVIVAESAPSYSGQETAVSLSNAGIETTLITDSAIYAMMARVNKVIVGTHAVVANGGLIALTGTHMLAQAAKAHSIPFVVCTGLYKLCPLHPHSYDAFNELKSPSEILKFEEVDDVEFVSVKNPAWDYIPPELISLYITNSGGHSPSYIYRLLAEYYHPEDCDI
jgi:translation initiation factor eIF-2B subunit beta